MTTADLAERLPNEEIDIVRPVVDRTGITGTWDMKLDWAWDAQIAGGGPAIFGALGQQLGLKLEPRKMALPILVIDHARQLIDR